MQGDATLAGGLTGALLAFEGIEDGAVILHGPSGCRGHHCSLSERAFPRDVHPERMNFMERFYFGQPRIPTTCLDGDDFVFGAAEKLRQALAARRLAERLGGVAVIPQCGAPMGFDATEEWVTEVAKAAGSDPSPAMAAIRQVRRRVATVLSRVTALTGAPRGLTAGISADPSTALPLARFLFEYLSVLPVSVETPNGCGTPWSARLDAALDEMGCREARNVPWQTVSPDFLLADGCQVAQGPAFGLPTQGGIELTLPLSGYVDLAPKALLGAGGAAYLVERIVNAYCGLL
jgi:nitrogenase molybdenum-iron protein alpha/beta subunit